MLNQQASDNNAASLEERCLELYSRWTGKSKLAVAYLLYTDKRLSSHAFVTRVAAELGSRVSSDDRNLANEELVALALMFYFRKSWEFKEASL